MDTLARHKRRRLACLIAFVCAMALVYASSAYVASVSYLTASGPQYKGSIGYGVLRFTADPSAGERTSRRLGWWWQRPVRYGFNLEMPWRPYHTKGGDEHGLVIPLWYVPALALGALLYAHGVVRGARLGVRGACVHCGYDLAGLPAGAAACPECGKDPRVAPLTPPAASPLPTGTASPQA